MRLFMVTYGKDLEWAELSLRSIKKFGTGFNTTILVPSQDYEAFKVLKEKYDFDLRDFRELPGMGFVHHLAEKCHADLWCPHDEWIAHIDADCIFGEPFSPETFKLAGKPILLRERYDDMISHPHRYGWRETVFNATGYDCEWETMVRHPGIFHRKTYRTLRNLVELRHGMPFYQYVVRQKNDFPQTFAEFPALGVCALEFYGDDYALVSIIATPSEHWQPLGILPVPVKERWGSDGGRGSAFIHHPAIGGSERVQIANPVRYFWSKEGVTPTYRAQIEQLLA